uniref:Histone H1 n=1 Tax=viral metagenome TaxID=1070528 RepID=A0A6M3JUM1_9ZZZZ
MQKLLDEMKEVLEDADIDIEKFVNGTNAAGSRARKKMQAIKKMAQELRIKIQDEKNKRAGKGGGKVAKKKAGKVKKAEEKKVVKEKKGKK